MEKAEVSGEAYSLMGKSGTCQTKARICPNMVNEIGSVTSKKVNVC